MERNTHKITIGLPNHIIEHLDLDDFNLYMKKAIPRMSLFVELYRIHWLNSRVVIFVDLLDDSLNSTLHQIDKGIAELVERYFL